MNLNLFENQKINNDSTSKFIEELRKALKDILNGGKDVEEKNNELEEYNLYEKKKILLDNKSRKGNDLAWIMDKDSVCISEAGDGGPISVEEIDLPKGIQIGEVYEKIDGKYIYNKNITKEINEIIQ